MYGLHDVDVHKFVKALTHRADVCLAARQSTGVEVSHLASHARVPVEGPRVPYLVQEHHHVLGKALHVVGVSILIRRTCVTVQSLKVSGLCRQPNAIDRVGSIVGVSGLMHKDISVQCSKEGNVGSSSVGVAIICGNGGIGEHT